MAAKEGEVISPEIITPEKPNRKAKTNGSQALATRPPTVEDLMSQALAGGADIETLERLFALRQQIKAERDREAFYLVKRRGGTSKYVVRVWQDADGQLFIECPCKAGFPPLLQETHLPAWEPGPCFHAAATLLSIAETDKQKEQENVTSITNTNA